MNFLIRLVGRIIARRIERGSRGGAAVGVLMAGIVTAALHALEITSRYTVAVGIFLAIAFGVAGSILGALVPRNAQPLVRRDRDPPRR